MRNVHKWYFKRLWNAILGKEYREAYYQYGLNDLILELIIEFIDSDRCGYPCTYTEQSWEKKLRGVKQTIQEFQELDEKGWDIENETMQECTSKYNKVQRKMLRDIIDIFPNLLD